MAETMSTVGGLDSTAGRPYVSKTVGTGKLEKYFERKPPGYTGYVRGAKFTMARTPFSVQADAEEVITNDEPPTGTKERYGFKDTPKPLARPATTFGLPGLHPQDFDSSTCRPPNIVGNPSNNHNVTFGDPRIPGSYSAATINRETYKGAPARLVIPGETPLTELYKTPAELKHAYGRALARVGKKKVEELISSMSNRINAKLGNKGGSAFNMRSKLVQLADLQGDDIHIDAMRQLMMSICGITLEIDDLLALFAVYDSEGSGSISLTELMEVLVDKDYFAFFLGNNIALSPELTIVTDEDRESLRNIMGKVHEWGDQSKAFRMFDINNDNRISRSEFKLTMEKYNCPLSPAGLDMMWSKAESSGSIFIDYPKFCKVIDADYADYTG